MKEEQLKSFKARGCSRKEKPHRQCIEVKPYLLEKGDGNSHQCTAL